MRLTRGEAWWLVRRRSRMTAEEFAEEYRVSLERLRRWERDREAAPLLPSTLGLAPLSYGEFGTLCRRRKREEARALAERLRVSLVTFRRMERDRTRTASRLAVYWLRRGVPRALAPAPFRIRGPSENMRYPTEDRGGPRIAAPR